VPLGKKNASKKKQKKGWAGENGGLREEGGGDAGGTGKGPRDEVSEDGTSFWTRL